MSQIKNAQIRYRVIDKAIRNPHKPYPSKNELRAACEEAVFGNDEGDNICASTIEKDLFAMREELDAPIRYSKKYNGYYYTDSEFSLSDVPLTNDDLEAIRFAASTLSQFRDISMFRQFGFAIDKIVDRVTVSEKTPESDEGKFLQFETGYASGNSHFLSTLLQSIRNATVVYFDYESFQSQNKKPRKVLPLLLKEYRNRWYLLSYDLVKSSIITYALDRMSNLETSEEKLTIPVSFNPESFFRHSIGITASSGFPEKVLFKADNVAAKYIASQPLHHSQVLLKEGKNRTTFTIEVYTSEELIRTFLSYGPEIEVLEPESLRDEIKERAGKLTQRYHS